MHNEQYLEFDGFVKAAMTHNRLFSPFVSVLCNRTACHRDCDQEIMKNAGPLLVVAKICKLHILFSS